MHVYRRYRIPQVESRSIEAEVEGGQAWRKHMRMRISDEHVDQLINLNTPRVWTHCAPCCYSIASVAVATCNAVLSCGS